MRSFLGRLIQLIFILLFLVLFSWLSFRLADNLLFYQGAGLTYGTASYLGGEPPDFVQLIHYEVDGETYVYEKAPSSLWMYESPLSYHFLYQRDDPTDVRLYYEFSYLYLPLIAWLFSGSFLVFLTWAFLRHRRPKQLMSEQEEKDINARVIEEYRANAGVVGAEFAELNLLLLHTTGAKSGQPRINPLECLEDGERYVVFASYAGEPRHPDWYYNLLADPNVTVEYKTESFEAVAHIAGEPERSQLYARMEALSEGFKDYKHTAKRVIPVVVLERK